MDLVLVSFVRKGIYKPEPFFCNDTQKNGKLDVLKGVLRTYICIVIGFYRLKVVLKDKKPHFYTL